MEIAGITAAEEIIITDMSSNNKFIANPVPETIMDELTDNFLELVNVPYTARNNLMSLFPKADDPVAIAAMAWAVAYKERALMLFKEDTVSFPLPLVGISGDTLTMSIKRSSPGQEKPWYVNYVPEAYKWPTKPNRWSNDWKAENMPTSEVSPCASDEQSNGSGEFKYYSVEQVEPKGVDFYYKPGEFAYVKIERLIPTDDPDKYEDKYFLRAIDGVSVSKIKKSIAHEFLGDRNLTGTFHWVRLREAIVSGEWGTQFFMVFREKAEGNQEYIERENRVLREHYSTGDEILAPIVAINPDGTLTVELGPNTPVSVAATPELAKLGVAVVGKPGLFTIRKLDEGEQVELEAVEGYIPRSPFKDCLPGALDQFYIPKVVMDEVRGTKLSEQSVEQLNAEGLSFPTIGHKALQSYIGRKYLEAKESYKVITTYRNNHFAFDFDLGIRSSAGVPMSAAFREGENGQWIMNLYGFTNVKRVFYGDIDMRGEDWDRILPELSSLALPGENWDYEENDEAGKKYYILKQYLIFTYYKAWIDGLIIENEEGNALFNTGLVDDRYKDIYCHLVKISDVNESRFRKWKMDFVACWGIGHDGKRLKKEFSEHPQAPEYIDRDHLEDLFMDTRKEIDCDWDHIIKERFDRLPLSFIERELSYKAPIRKLINDIRSNDDVTLSDQLKEAVVGDPDNMRKIVEALEVAVEVTKKHVRWNYKTAVPTYYPKKNRISLLLPLWLSGRSETADIALVVSPTGKSGYQGETILTLPMAYMNARLICRPNSEWLTTDLISDEDDFLEEE